MKDEWEEFNAIGLTAVKFVNSLPPDYQYKVMRRKIKTSREQFIEACCDKCPGSCFSADYGRLYDVGLRFT